MNCINIKHPDFQMLLNKTGMHTGILQARISEWMDKNTTDRFPTVKELQIADRNSMESPKQAKLRILKTLNAGPAGFVNRQKYGPLLKEVGDYNKEHPNSLKIATAASGNYYIIIQKPSPLFQLKPTEKDLKPAIEELDKHLLDFLKDFGVDSKKFDSLKERLGVDALGATDVLNKLIWYTKNRNEETLPEEAGHMIVALMGEQNDTIKSLLENITAWDEYAAIEKQYMPIYKNKKQVEIEAVGKLIAKALVKNYKTVGLDESLIQKAIKAIVKFLNEFFNNAGLYNPHNYSEKLADKIALNVLAGNAEFIGNLQPTAEQLNYGTAVRNNKHANNIIEVFAKKLGFPLTGSLAIAAQGENIYRPNNEPIHDLDFIVDGTNKENIKALGKQLKEMNAVAVHGGWEHKDYVTAAYYIPKEGFTVKVVKRKNGWAKGIQVFNSKGEVVPANAQNVISTDFFIYREKAKLNTKGDVLSWNSIYKGKLSLSPLEGNERMFQREKDQTDYLLLKPVHRDFNPDPAFVYYQLNEEAAEDELYSEEELEKTKKKFLEDTLDAFRSRLAKLKIQSKEKSATAALSKDIEILEKQIAKNEFDLAIENIIKTADRELTQIQNILNKHGKENKLLKPSTAELIDHFAEMYSSLFKTLLKDFSYYNVPINETEGAIGNIEQINFKLHRIQNQNSKHLKRIRINALDAANTDEHGNKIDENFDPRKEEALIKEDASWWRLYVGNWKMSNSPIIRAAHKLISDSVRIVKRFAVNKANELLLAQSEMEKAGYKVEQLVEKTPDGTPSQYLIRKHDWGSYYAKLIEYRKNLAKQFGKEEFSDIDVSALSKEQKKVYKDSFKAFAKENLNSRKLPNGTWENTPKVLNPEFEKLMKVPQVKAYYNILLTTIAESVNKLPLHYQTEAAYYKIPGIRKQSLERLSNLNQPFLANIKALKDELFSRDEDDTQFGNIEYKNSLNNKIVPIFFTKTLSDPKNLSLDLTRSVTIFAEMAENFQQMNKIAGKMFAIKKDLALQKYEKGKKWNTTKIEGKETNDYKILDTLIDTYVYGVQKKDIEVELGKKTYSASKLVQRITSFIRTNNLALNITTSTAGYLKGTVDSVLEDQIGIYSTMESKHWARGEYFKNLPHVVSETGSHKQTNKMHLLLQLTNVVELSKVVKNTNKNKFISEAVSRDILFLNYKTADYAIKGRIMLAILDNHRLYNGKFISKEAFIKLKETENLEYGARTQSITKGIGAKKDKKTIDAEWKSLKDKSLYNAYEVVNGKLEVKAEFKDIVNDATLNRVTGQIEHVTHIVDGTISETDRGALSRSIFGDFLLMHRGWFINTLDTRFKKEYTNMITGEKEIGTHNAFFNKFLWQKTIMELKTPMKALSLMQNYKELNPAEQRGVKKSMLDLLYLNIIALLAAVVNLAADDDDDENWTMQYFSYQMNRVLLEQGAAWSPKEVLQMVDEPVVGVRTIKDLVDFSELWNFEEFERGMYKGKTHSSKWLIKKTPFKSVYELQYPKMKNNFIKQVLDSKYYNDLSPGDNEKGFSFLGMFKNMFTDQEVSPKELEELESYREYLE